ncbi:hypothetical protein BDV34DRAFT_3615 [Aspergillus parasiticus]|uniref:Uncharacterized protein n=1 Tax=Aspergillus parasiticus TaxID=5067 RepID=A0A5N6E4T5_ASPPA|nr:hypothetical protein BDV34DRAFT_3615 [Aspergillus parasiticus]
MTSTRCSVDKLKGTRLKTIQPPRQVLHWMLAQALRRGRALSTGSGPWNHCISSPINQVSTNPLNGRSRTVELFVFPLLLVRHILSMTFHCLLLFSFSLHLASELTPVSVAFSADHPTLLQFHLMQFTLTSYEL